MTKEHQEKLLREIMQNDEELGLYSEMEYCQCISRIGIDVEEFGKWTCSSCKKEVFNNHRQY